MKPATLLIIASLLSIVLSTFHLADDIARGFESGGLATLSASLIFVVWLYGTLMLAERKSGYIIVILGSLLGLAAPVLHMMGNGVGIDSRIGNTPGALFFVWTLYAVAVTSLFSIVLAVRGLWNLRGQTR